MVFFVIYYGQILVMTIRLLLLTMSIMKSENALLFLVKSHAEKF